MTGEHLNGLDDILYQYDEYFAKTLEGEHGATAQYVIMYVHFIDLYQLYERSLRTNDMELNLYAMHEMCAIFFAFNHQNYAKYLSLYFNNLLNCGKTHQGISAYYRNGGMSTRRTAKNFARSGNDLVLEQTINAHAGNKYTGISSMTKSIEARQRWAVTHGTRTEIFANFYATIGILKADVSEDDYMSKVFRKQVYAYTQEVGKNINPFSPDINAEKLFNLSTGKAVSLWNID